MSYCLIMSNWTGELKKVCSSMWLHSRMYTYSVIARDDHSGEEGELSAQHSQVILTISCSLFLSDAEAKQALDQLQNRKKSDRKKEL